MSTWRPKSCKDCLTTVPPISARGLCVECAIIRQTKSAVQQSKRSGPYYEAWKARMRELIE